MPEGHTVHRLARAFADAFVGERLAVSSPQGRFAAGAALLDGWRLRCSEAWGKQLFLGFGDGDGAGGGAAVADSAREMRWLRVHLGLYGAWTFSGDASFAGPQALGAPRVRVSERESALPAPSDLPEQPGSSGWAPPAPRGAVRVRLIAPHAVADLTGPTVCEVLDDDGVAAVQARLGPDPLRPETDAGSGSEAFMRTVRASRAPVGTLLMDQSVIAGIGNIYRAELLFRARLHPRRVGSSVSARALRALWSDAVETMSDGVRTGRILTTDAADRERTGLDWYAYHRTGMPCVRLRGGRECGARIVEDAMAGRRVFWCPRCQRLS